MKNLTDQDVKILVQNGALMHIEDNNNYVDIISSPGVSQVPLGYPVAINKEKITVPNVKNLFVLSKINSSEDVYIIPYGLLALENFQHNEKALNLLKDWNELTLEYIDNITQQDITIVEDILKTYRNVEDLLKIYREIVYECIKDKIVGKNLSDDNVLLYYLGGSKYRANSKSDIKDKLLSREESDQYFSRLLESKEDIVSFEKSALNFNKNRAISDRKIGMKTLEIYGYLYKLWYALNDTFFENKAYNNQESLFLKHLDSYLEFYSCSSAETIRIIKEIQRFDIESSKEILVKLFNTSTQKAVVKYLEKYLDSHNALPSIKQELLLSSSTNLVYANTLQYNYNLIKQSVENNPMTSQTLVNIVGCAFKKEEKDYYRFDWNILHEQGIVEFKIESLEEQTTIKLSKYLSFYLEAALCSQFLNEQLKKQITKNGINRVHYESNKDIMDQYLKCKNIIVFNNDLEENLETKKQSKKTRKI